ncbi:f-box domain-containing protein [Caerostris darwini]|uniref:F-box domain-containing protein n=1 Tax=Caerostris darwini TaxID=1538125 RepID=A0AAV4NJI4_9ARAC|nr:f-box domain-containing protein [Caerostris darwini]
MFSSNSDSEDIPWDKLPYVTLILIYKFLEIADRFNASLVCHSWFHAFESGTLWKKTNFVFSGDMVDDSRKALKFAKKHANSLKDLKIHFRKIDKVLIQEALNNLQLLFECLESFSQLYFFDLENFYHYPSHRSPSAVVALANRAFKGFLKSQHHLKKIAFINVRLSESDGLDILTEIAEQNQSLEHLGLTYFFESFLDVHRYDQCKNKSSYA